MSDFEATIRSSTDGDGVRPGVVVVALTGQLDGTATDAMEQAYADAVTADVSALVLDFTQVTYINSTGIALVVALLAKARAASLEVRVCGLTDHYKHVFEITRLVDFMTVFADAETAVAAGTKGG